MRKHEDNMKMITEHIYGTWRPQKKWKNPLYVSKAEGVYLYDDTGKPYLDFSSQLMCSNLGHGNKAIMEALCKQAKEIMYISPGFACEAKAKAAEALLKVMPSGLDRFFFSTSGTEAADKFTNKVIIADKISAEALKRGMYIHNWYDPSLFHPL